LQIKNRQNGYEELSQLDVRKSRVIISGTPFQGHLQQFYTLLDFCNQNVAGLQHEFNE